MTPAVGGPRALAGSACRVSESVAGTPSHRAAGDEMAAGAAGGRESVTGETESGYFGASKRFQFQRLFKTSFKKI